MYKVVIMKSFFTIVVFCFALQNASAHSFSWVKDTLPYAEIPNNPEKYTPETVMARMIDGIGFRYYWATEGLRKEDLAFRPSPKVRTSEETIDHILGLSTMIINALQQKANTKSGEETSSLTFEVKRKQTLDNLKMASEMLKNGKVTLDSIKIIMGKTELPAWNLINGPIEDAAWHIGQVVSFRRSTGNGFNGKASVLMGKVRE